MLIIRYLIFVAIFLGSAYSWNAYTASLQKWGLSETTAFTLLLLLSYFFVTFWEIWSCARLGKSYAEIRKRSFLLSFLIAFTFWTLVFLLTHPISFLDIVEMVIVFTVYGCLWGLVGWFSAKFYWVFFVLKVGELDEAEKDGGADTGS